MTMQLKESHYTYVWTVHCTHKTPWILLCWKSTQVKKKTNATKNSLIRISVPALQPHKDDTTFWFH